MTQRRGRTTRSTAALLAVISLAGCAAGEVESDEAAAKLQQALVDADSAVVRDLVADTSRPVRDDLLTDEVLSDGAFAGADLELERDVDQVNGTADYTLRTADDSGARMSFTTNVWDETTPDALPYISYSSHLNFDSLIVNDHEIALEPRGPELRSEISNSFYLPPGKWTVAPPQHEHYTADSVTVDLSDYPSSDLGSIDLVLEPTEAGIDAAIASAEDFVARCDAGATAAECAVPATDCPDSDHQVTVTYSDTPEWRVREVTGLDGWYELQYQPDLERTVTSRCGDSATDPETTTAPAAVTGRVSFTSQGAVATFDPPQ